MGTDYHEYVVGYNCRTGHKRRKILNLCGKCIKDIWKIIDINFNAAEVVVQTRQKKVPLQYLHQAFSVIRQNDLPLNDMVCQEGFGPPRNLKKQKSPKKPNSKGPAPLPTPPSPPPPPPPSPPPPSPPPPPPPVSENKSDKSGTSKDNSSSGKTSDKSQKSTGDSNWLK